jgi:hypothetical protein
MLTFAFVALFTSELNLKITYLADEQLSKVWSTHVSE